MKLAAWAMLAAKGPPSLHPWVPPTPVPILTGKPGGRRRVMKSRSLAKSALLIAIRSMMGATCSQRDSGWSSHSHSFALNLRGRGGGTQVPGWGTPGTPRWQRGGGGTARLGGGVPSSPLAPSLLRLGGELHGPPHVPVAQLEVGVEVLLGGDGRGVGVAQRLRDQRLRGRPPRWHSVGGSQPRGPPSLPVPPTLTPLLGPTCCSAMPRKDCSGVLLPAG